MAFFVFRNAWLCLQHLGLSLPLPFFFFSGLFLLVLLSHSLIRGSVKTHRGKERERERERERFVCAGAWVRGTLAELWLLKGFKGAASFLAVPAIGPLVAALGG